MLKLHLKIKVRAFFTDLFTFEKTVPLDVIGALRLGSLSLPLLNGLKGELINERGVLLEIV